jgi:N-acetylmuramoyl-L-alanine amidase
MLGKLRRVDPEVPDLGVKQAPFVVLIGARMPSILAEISFLSNEQDARLLSTETYRDLIADALFDGVIRYQRALGSDAIIAVADNSGE